MDAIRCIEQGTGKTDRDWVADNTVLKVDVPKKGIGIHTSREWVNQTSTQTIRGWIDHDGQNPAISISGVDQNKSSIRWVT